MTPPPSTTIKESFARTPFQRVDPRTLPEPVNSPGAIKLLRATLITLILVLVFEGLARKLQIKGTNVVIFLLKDVIVAALGIQIVRMHRPKMIDWFWTAYLVEIALFLPVIISTAWHDPVLAVFGAKEYLLYPIVAFAVFISFAKAKTSEMISFFRWLALLVLPTAGIAILQIRLPPDHWLNLSVEGTDLDGFSAGGQLRVSSTFSFVAQYCAFINAEVFLVMAALNNLRDVKWYLRGFYLLTVPLMIISSYITGSRGAVLVNCAIIAIAAALSLMRFQVRSALRVILIIGGLLITLVVAHQVLPDAFSAYSTREEGHLLGASTEIQQRIYGSLFDWMGDAFSTPFFGYGLGIMSNGSELLSSYAYEQRASAWTETDFATTLFEGGLYLVIIWYAFRYFVIYQVTRLYMRSVNGEFALPGAFCVGFVIVIGLSGTLAIQPPIAIWWWLSVGSGLLFWWKSIEPKEDADGNVGAPPPVQEKKIRGQSPYAARLHAQSKTP